MKIIFLDRDDTIIVDKKYMSNPEDIEFMPHVIEALKSLQEEYKLVMVTNQSGIGREYFTEDDFKKFTDVLILKLIKHGIHFYKIFYCPHIPKDKCECRKPKTGMVDDFIKNNDIDLKNSWVLGDKPMDMEFADRLGCRSIMLMNIDRASKIILGERE